jgi:hypothetical protein
MVCHLGRDVVDPLVRKNLRKNLRNLKNKIKNIGGAFTKIYGSESSNFSSCFLQIKNING